MTEENETPAGPLGDRFTETNRFFDPEDQVSLREIALVPWKRKFVVIGCILVCVSFAIFVSVMMHPRYKSTATIELNEEKNSGADALSSIAAMVGGDQDDLKVKIETETAVIKNDTIALAVMDKMGMLRLENPNRSSKEEGPLVKSPDELPPEQRDGLIGNFEAHLQVNEVGSSRLIAITYTSEDQKQAADVANEVVHQYKLYLLNSNFNSSKEVSQWLTSQLGNLSDQVARSQKAVADFERSHNLSSSMPGLTTLGGGGSASASGVGGGGGGGSVRIPELDRLTTLNDEVTQAEAVRLEREAIYRLTASENPDLISSLGSSTLPGLSNSTVISQGNGLEVLNALREQDATARVAYASAETKYGAKNPRLADIANQLKSLREQMQSEMEKIKQRAKNDLVLAQENEKSLRAAYEAQKLVTSKMNDDVVQLGVLMAQARSSRELSDILYARLQEANIDAGNSATNVTLADPARPPGSPSMPQPFLFVFLGFFGGLFSGVGLAYLLESQDDTLTDSFQVETVSKLPVLGMIPFHRIEARVREGALAAESSAFLVAPESATAESFRSLRSGLTLSGVGRKLKVLSITSALPGEGKSYTVYNLGLAFAATGLKVLIIDADLRRPRQHALFRQAREDGLADVLSGLKSFDEALAAHPIEPNLLLLSAGRQSPLASELLGSGEIEKLIATARQRFDLVLIDNPPVLPVADAIIVGTYCDGTIGVLRAGRTSRKALRRFVLNLARNRIHILGMVIEAVDMSATEYRSVYGYNVQSYYGEK
ncbi:MAG: polysaccharide biosynthesis tyrosine autokinase [Terracidiphilus sp.]|jgi:capsular exopolysaccharide synthesis family protein